MLFSYRKEDPGFDDRLDRAKLFGAMNEDSTKTFIYVLNVMQCVFAAIQVMAFLFKYIPSIYNKTKFEYDDEAEKQVSILDVMSLKAKFVLRFLGRIFMEPGLYSNFAYFILALLGIFIHPLFFTYHLLTVIFRFRKLIDVLQAFWGPITEIILTLVFFFILEYVFAVIGYVAFAEMYPEYTCFSLLACFITTLDQTFKNNGGFGAFMDPIFSPDDEDETVAFDVGRLFFDQISNLVLLILIVQILAGLIIDRFGQIREASENMEEELKSNCIICGENADLIERKSGNSFDYHKIYIHSLWNYILYIGYLRKKLKGDYNAIESRIHLLFKDENIEWLPYSLGEGKNDEEQIEKMNELIKDIKSIMDDENKT